MMVIHKMLEIPLDPGELVVSATYYHDSIVVVTDRGSVYRIERTP